MFRLRTGQQFFFLRRFRKSVRILKLKVPLFCGSDGISWKGHVTVAPRVLKLKVPVFCGSDGISWKGHVTVAPSPKLGKGKKKKEKKGSAISVTIGESKLVVVRDRAVICRVQNLILSREVLVHGRRTS